jgi:hypothetical protein
VKLIGRRREAPDERPSPIRWESTDAPRIKGFISNPVGKAKSVVFTDKGLEELERLLIERFVKPQA